jgi:hypothetical protein
MFVVAAIVLWLSRKSFAQNLLTAKRWLFTPLCAGRGTYRCRVYVLSRISDAFRAMVRPLGNVLSGDRALSLQLLKIAPAHDPVAADALFSFVTFFALLMYFFPEVNDVLFGVLILGFVVFVVFTQRRLKTKIQHWYIIVGVVAYYTGSTFWVLDKELKLCVPQSLWQGHAAWHLLSATATLFVYLYFRSEKQRTN